MAEQSSAWMAEAVTGPDGGTVVTVGGERHEFTAADLQQTRAQVLQRVRQVAAQSGRPVLLTAREPQASWRLAVQPDGHVEVAHDDPPTTPPSDPAAAPAAAQVAVDAPETPAAAASGTYRAAGWPPQPDVPAGPAVFPTDERPRSSSFLAVPEPAAEPDRTGWRGVMARMGWDPGPSARDREEQRFRADVAAVARHWSGPRTILVANGKGGSSKTPLTIGLASVFARYGGGGTVAWGNHQLRGTLGWHTVADPHAATTADLLAAAPRLLQSSGRLGDLSRYVHHQPADMYDVLQADPTKTADRQRSSRDTVATVHQVLSRYYRLIVVDSDNDESAPHWLAMVDHADQLVVACTNRDVHAETGRLMLEDLRSHRGPGARRLAEHAVVVVSQTDVDEAPPAVYAAKFADELGLKTACIPYDRGMKGVRLAFDNLQPATRRAYLAAAATVANALT